MPGINIIEQYIERVEFLMFKSLFKKVRKSKGGFTLIELIAVIAILGILAVILIPTIGSQIKTAKQNSANTTANSIFTAAQLYLNDLDTSALPTDGDYDKSSALVTAMGNSKYFKSINLSNLTTCTLTINDGSVTKVVIKDSNGDGTYPKA